LGIQAGQIATATTPAAGAMGVRRLSRRDAHRQQAAPVEQGHDLALAGCRQRSLAAKPGPTNRFKRKLRHTSPHEDKATMSPLVTRATSSMVVTPLSTLRQPS